MRKNTTETRTAWRLASVFAGVVSCYQQMRLPKDPIVGHSREPRASFG